MKMALLIAMNILPALS